MPRVEHDDLEGIYYDTTRPIHGQYGNRGQLYEECDPLDVCAEMEAELAQLRADNERMEGVVRFVRDVLDDGDGALHRLTLALGDTAEPCGCREASCAHSPFPPSTDQIRAMIDTLLDEGSAWTMERLLREGSDDAG